MVKQLFRTIGLENGLQLEIWDLSRKIAGDRWLVSLELRVDVPLMERHFQSLPEKEKAMKALRTRYGDKITYKHKIEKHFVSHEQRETVFLTFMDTARKGLLEYLSRSDFMEKFTLATCKKLKAENPQLFL